MTSATIRQLPKEIKPEYCELLNKNTVEPRYTDTGM